MKLIIKSEIPKFAKYGFVNVDKANKIAASNTLNTQAFLSRKNGIKNIEDEFILRNTFTKRQIQVTKQTDMRLAIRNMKSIVGATKKADYLALHEDGGIKRPRKGNRLAMAQKTARGGSKRHLVLSRYHLKNIKKKRLHGNYKTATTKKSRFVARAAMAAKKKNYFINLNDNIYQIISFYKIGKRVHFTKKHIYYTGHRTARIDRVIWMKKAIQKPSRDVQNIYNSNIKKLLRQKKII